MKGIWYNHKLSRMSHEVDNNSHSAPLNSVWGDAHHVEIVSSDDRIGVKLTVTKSTWIWQGYSNLDLFFRPHTHIATQRHTHTHTHTHTHAHTHTHTHTYIYILFPFVRLTFDFPEFMVLCSFDSWFNSGFLKRVKKECVPMP